MLGGRLTAPWALMKTALVFGHVSWPLAVVEFGSATK